MKILQELLGLYEAKATIKAFKITVPSGCKATEDQIFGNEEGDDSFIHNQEIVTVEYIQLKGNTLYVYPMMDLEPDMSKDTARRLQREFDSWCANLKEAKNHLGEREYGTWSGWRAACKKANPDVWFEGDKDIAQAMVGPKPYKHGETKAIGEWDGEKGSVYNVVKESSEKETQELPNGVRPKGIGWVLKKAGEQTGKNTSSWERTVKSIEQVGRNTAEAGRGQSARDVTEGKGPFGMKLGGVSSEELHFGFEDRSNAIKTERALKAADIEFTRNSAGGIFYFNFESKTDMKKAIKAAEQVIDKSVESEW